MNNKQFRRLVLDTPRQQNAATENAQPSGAPSAFGGKRVGFMPMTPRTVKGSSGDVDFARQVRERNAALQTSKSFKSSAPKGVKYGKGYTDRAKARAEAENDGDDKEQRIKALEEQMKLGQISQEMFESLRDQITGGSLDSTHLVKGLDKRLLDRVRRGEDVMGTGNGSASEEAGEDVDDKLDKLGAQDFETIKKEKSERRGIMAPPPVAGVKRSRDEIMAELKAQRAAAKADAASSLDNRWKKVGQKEKSRIEIDHKGREVLITVDEDGMVKRKVRKIDPSRAEGLAATAMMPDASKPVLGADVTIPQQAPIEPRTEEDDNDDIFAGVGTEYDPLGEDDEDDEDSSSDSGGEKAPKDNSVQNAKTNSGPISNSSTATHPSKPDGAKYPTDAPIVRRSYFKETPLTEEELERDRFAGVDQLLKKAAKMESQDETDRAGNDDREAETTRLQKRAAMLTQRDRDLDDMDMGFGESRFDDGEDEGDGKTRLSEWRGLAADEQEEDRDGGKRGGEKKKRKPKKRKGDVNNAADIMRVIEGRKTAAAK